MAQAAAFGRICRAIACGLCRAPAAPTVRPMSSRCKSRGWSPPPPGTLVTSR